MNQRSQPVLNTARLTLRPLAVTDSARIQLLAGEAHFANVTENIPHPYEDGMALQFIKLSKSHWEENRAATFGICLHDSDKLIGCCGLTIVGKHCRATLGYWIGRKYWGNGYCTEAAERVVDFGFKELNLHRIAAMHLTINPASGAVMRKIGMQHEATLKGYVLKNNQFEDMELYAILANRCE